MNISIPLVDGVRDVDHKDEEEQQRGTSRGFDPLSDLLVAQRDKPTLLTTVNLRTLTPYQRALLVIDGTVTKFIEAYTMEPVKVNLLDQEVRFLIADHEWLGVPAGTKVIARQVVLCGRYSHTFYAYAVSLLVFDRLPEGVRADLKKNPGGLGRILLKHQLETRREVLWYGRQQLTELPDAVRHQSDGKFISRTYRIMFEAAPLMLINENFPAGADPLLSHH